ncbi:hypothetical protein F4859DRAFT_8532 [Xylaria cf. heliscus]|nr:hypothetical protein F4859DRAFT_8532 [Xylaria cf. heliscus]
MARIRFGQPLVHQLRIQYLLIVPVLLSVFAAVILTTHGDVNIPLLYSQCHARSRLPALSRIPVLGSPACFLVSVFMLATASMRGVAQLGLSLSFVAALLTVCRVEAARACNQRSLNIRFPTLGWLAFNLVGGTFIWDLWIIPAFLKHAKDLRVERLKEDALEHGRENGRSFDEEERIMLERSFLTRADVYAVPLAVAVGFVVPSVLMLVLKDAVPVIVWLFFPIWVAAVHLAVKFCAVRLLRVNGPIYLESHAPSVTLVYALPFVASLFTNVLYFWNLFYTNDSREMTRSVLKFLEIDFVFVFVSVVYWVFAESGALPVLLMPIFSLFLGPGAGLCLTWIIREKAICSFAISSEEDVSDEESDGDDSTVHENTPLLN